MEKKRNHQFLKGVVVSDRMNKTRVIQIHRRSRHSLYGKSVELKRKYFIHDEKNESKIGDKVIAASCRPLSKNKSFRLLKVLERGSV